MVEVGDDENRTDRVRWLFMGDPILVKPRPRVQSAARHKTRVGVPLSASGHFGDSETSALASRVSPRRAFVFIVVEWWRKPPANCGRAHSKLDDQFWVHIKI